MLIEVVMDLFTSLEVGTLLLAALSVPIWGMVSDDVSEDSKIIREILDGNPNAYRSLVERYQGRIYNVIFGMVRDRDEAEELTQEAFVKAFRNLQGFRQEARFYTWLCRIAINLSIDFLRKRKRHATFSFDESIGVKEGGELADSHNLGNPHEELQNKEIRKRIIETVEKLPEEQKRVLVLREIDGLSYREISEILGIPEGTVMSRLYYARKKLQAELQDLL
jgi:RNA polymerase sigma-70 factor, ECF subfamily